MNSNPPSSRVRRTLALTLLAALTLIHATPHAQQQQEPEPRPPQGMGVVTGSSAVSGARRTAGITDPKAPVVFEDVTARTALAKFRHSSGSRQKDYIVETVSGGVAVFDYDNDGLPDIYLLNGSSIGAESGREKAPRAALYRNLGGWKFEDVTERAGVSNERWGMGVAAADYDNDGFADIYVGNFGTSRLYRNNGDGNFTDVTFQAGMGEPSIPFLGWGTAFFDYDADGWKDVVVANGHVYPVVDAQQWGTSYAQQLLLFRNAAHPDARQAERGARYFQRVGAAPGSGLAEAWPSRGLAVGDLDLDGRPDIVVNNLDAAPTLLRNVTDVKHHWLRLRLVGDTSKKSPRDATGATVYLTTGKLRQRADALSGGGYASQNDPCLYFGLGASTKVDRLEVRWPDGSTEAFAVPAIDKTLTLTQGKGTK